MGWNSKKRSKYEPGTFWNQSKLLVTSTPQSCSPSTSLQAYPCQMHHHVLQNVMKNLGCICNHSISNFSTPFQNKQKQTWLTFHQIPAILLLLCTLHQPYNHTCILLYAEMRKTQNITGYLNFQTVWNTYLNTTHLMSLSLSPTPFNHSSAIKTFCLWFVYRHYRR